MNEQEKAKARERRIGFLGVQASSSVLFSLQFDDEMIESSRENWIPKEKKYRERRRAEEFE